MRDAIQWLRSADIDSAGAASDARIAQAEHLLGFTLPIDYRDFVAAFGYAGIGSQEIYGIVGTDLLSASVPNAIGVTLSQRKLGLDCNLLLIASRGDGNWLAWDASARNADGRCAVVEVDVSLARSSRVADNFETYLIEVIALPSVTPSGE